MLNRIRILMLALCLPMAGCASFQSTLTMTATTADGNSVTIAATDGVLANNISKLVGDAQFQKGADGSSNTIVNLGSDRTVNTDNQESGLAKGIETIGTLGGAALGAMAGSGAAGVGAAPGAVVGGVTGNTIGKAVGDFISPAAAPAPLDHGGHPASHRDHQTHQTGSHHQTAGSNHMPSLPKPKHPSKGEHGRAADQGHHEPPIHAGGHNTGTIHGDHADKHGHGGADHNHTPPVHDTTLDD